METNAARAKTDPIERARRAVADRYPDAEIDVKSWRGKPVIVARVGNVVHLVRQRPQSQRRESRK